MVNRRQLITGLISFVAAPAIVRASSLMPVKALPKGLVTGSETTASEIEARLRKWPLPYPLRFCGCEIDTARFPDRESFHRAFNIAHHD